MPPSSNKNEREQQLLLIETTWNSVRGRINNNPEEAYCNRQLRASIQNLCCEMPFDIRANLATLINDAESIYDAFGIDDMEGCVDDFFEHEEPTEKQATEIFHSAIRADKQDLAESVTRRFPVVLTSMAVCSDRELATKVITVFPRVIENEEIIRKLISVYLESVDAGAEGSDLYALVQLALHRSLGHYEGRLEKIASQRCIAHSLVSYKQRFTDEIMMNPSFFAAYSGIIMKEHPEICGSAEVVGRSGMLMYAVRQEDVKFMRFLISRCPEIFPFSQKENYREDERHHALILAQRAFYFDEDERFIDHDFEHNIYQRSLLKAISERLPASITTLLGIGLPAEDMHIYPKELQDWDFRCKQLTTRSDNLVEKIVECIRICEETYPKVKQNLVSEWIASPKTHFTVEIMMQVVKDLKIDLSTGVGQTPLAKAVGEYSASHSTEEKSDVDEIRSVFSFVLNNEYSSSSQATVIRRGRLPLHLACDNGLRWSHGLDLIHNAHQSALGDTDKVTGLKPFALAAASFKRDHVDYDLNTVFELLHRDPTALSLQLSERN